MSFQLNKGERVRIDGIVWAVARRVPTGFQLLSVGDGIPRIISDAEFLASFRDGRLERLAPWVELDLQDSLNPMDRDFAAYSESAKAEATRRCRFLEEIQKRAGPPPYSNETLRALSAAVASELQDNRPPPSVRTLRRWIVRDKQVGHDVRGQIPKFLCRGNRKSRFSTIVQRLARETLDQYMMRPAPAPIKEIYSTLIVRLNREAALRPLMNYRAPSLATFYRWAQALDDEDRITAQRGRKAAEAKYLATESAPAETVPMAVVEIDHNYVDCLVVDEQGCLLGRPTLTVAIDRATRMCTGFVLSWEPPSSLSVMLVLRHMIRDKAYVKTTFGDLIDNDWPCFGVPKSIVIDNGMEFHSQHLRDACLQLGRISMEFAPTRSPRHKGKVERFVRTLNEQLFHLLPGTTLSRVDRLSEYAPSATASITLPKLNEFLHKFIIDIYSQTYHRGLEAVPAQAWRRGVELHPLRLPSSIKDLDILSCGRAERVVGRQGVEMFSLFYNSPELRSLRIRSKGKLRVNVRYDPTDIGQIWVPDPETGRHLTVACQAFSYASKLTIWQHRKVLEQLGKAKHGADERALHLARAQLRQLIDGAASKRGKMRSSGKWRARFVETPRTPDNLVAEGLAASNTGTAEVEPTEMLLTDGQQAEGSESALKSFIQAHGFRVREG